MTTDQSQYVSITVDEFAKLKSLVSDLRDENGRLRKDVALWREAIERRENLRAAFGFERKPGADYRGGA